MRTEERGGEGQTKSEHTKTESRTGRSAHNSRCHPLQYMTHPTNQAVLPAVARAIALTSLFDLAGMNFFFRRRTDRDVPLSKAEVLYTIFPL